MAAANGASAEHVPLSYDPDGPALGRAPNRSFQGSVDQPDSYTQAIELSNACRRSYVSRKQVADRIKRALGRDLGSSGHRPLDCSMGRLHRQLVSLVDQDLSLMRQLLTLNERIEDLKWQRTLVMYNPNSSTTSAGSGNIVDSDTSSDWEGDTRVASERLRVSRGPAFSDRDLVCTKYLSPSNLSVFRDCVYNSNHNLNDTNAADVGGTQVVQHNHRTSAMGTPRELVNDTVDDKSLISYSAMSHDHSSVSVDSPSSSSLRKAALSDSLLSGDIHLHAKPDSLKIGARVKVSTGVHFDSTEYSHDSGIQVVDHNMEMII